MKKQIITATALMLAISSTAYASDNINIFVNGNALNTGAFIMNDSTYIPLRAVSEARFKRKLGRKYKKCLH